ncbi:MAG TPA: HAD hydrolase family protein [Gammaproteobacteria bacterium]|jgi:3-deoxy-D-manno-octulosonate 8-phosphate phosphatase (KDO 8-P phosphatase)|nr:HAD hydrolase family protein [Gammaproteobacteria bacterium]
MDLRERAARIKLVVFDVDGVFTDGSLYYGPGGEELKVFNVQDGQGVKRLLAAGIDAAVISGRDSAAVTRRMRDLGITHVFQGDEDKLPVLERLLKKLGLTLEQAAHVGDDLPDLPLFQRVGLAVAPANAMPVIKAASHHVTAAAGGSGAVREVCDLLLTAQGHA